MNLVRTPRTLPTIVLPALALLAAVLPTPVGLAGASAASDCPAQNSSLVEGCVNEVEPNDECAQAFAQGANTGVWESSNFEGTLQRIADADNVDIVRSMGYKGEMLHAQFGPRQESGRSFWVAANAACGPPWILQEKVFMPVEASGRYFAAIAQNYGGTDTTPQAYRGHMAYHSVEAPHKTATAPEHLHYDAPDTREYAVRVNAEVFTGTLTPAGDNRVPGATATDQDWYTIQVPSPAHVLRVSMTPESNPLALNNFCLALYKPSGQFFAESCGTTPQALQGVGFLGDWFVGVYPAGATNPGGYSWSAAATLVSCEPLTCHWD